VAPRLVSDRLLIDRLASLFRATGFEAASLAQIAEATGLQKSSLYHRFPGGKEQMSAEVVRAVAQHFADEVLAPLSTAAPLETRVRQVGRRLDAFYDGGARGCLLDMLSVGNPGSEASAALAAAAEGWMAAFTAVAREAGATRAEAATRAQDAMVAIEGALVLARVTGDKRPFSRALKRLPDVLLASRRP
jgi:TetR/AcrR family transcriptional repressor of lmrAB and yxaGH operons